MDSWRLGPLVADLLGLVLPVECAGCGAWDCVVCPECRELLAGPLVRCEEGAAALGGTSGGRPVLPVWSLAAYAGPVRGIVLAWKRGRADLDAVVATAGRRAGRAWAAKLAPLVPPGRPVWVLPVPSGRRRRAQGRFVVGGLARAVAAGLADASPGHDIGVVDALRRGSGRARQVGLGAAGRVANRRRGTRLVRRLPPGSACLLVDDVVTTGATLAAAHDALAAPGHLVVGAAVLAATPAPPARS